MQWLTDDEVLDSGDPALHRRIASEVADVTIYLARLSDVLGLDLARAVHDKLIEVEDRYRASEVRGSASKR
jgi:hypothetical protein